MTLTAALLGMNPPDFYLQIHQNFDDFDGGKTEDGAKTWQKTNKNGAATHHEIISNPYGNINGTYLGHPLIGIFHESHPALKWVSHFRKENHRDLGILSMIPFNGRFMIYWLFSKWTM